MSTDSDISKRLLSFEAVVQPFVTAQAGLGGEPDGMSTHIKRASLAKLLNELAMLSPKMLVQLIVKLDKGLGTKTFFAEKWIHEIPRDSPNFGGVVVNVLTPGQVAALAPLGFNNRGTYRFAGELLHFGPEGVEQRCVGREAFTRYCTSHSVVERFVLLALNLISNEFVYETKTFRATSYWEPDEHGKVKPRYSTVYLKEGYGEVEFYRELGTLLEAVAAYPRREEFRLLL